MGLTHIIEQRTADGTLSFIAREELFEALALAIVSGISEIQAETNGKQRIKINLNDSSVILAKNPDENAWILTGWTISKEKLEELKNLPPEERRSVFLTKTSTLASSPLPESNEGAGGKMHPDARRSVLLTKVATLETSLVPEDNKGAEGNRKVLWDKSHTSRLSQENLERTRGLTGPEPSSASNDTTSTVKAQNAEQLAQLMLKSLEQGIDIPNAFKREDMDMPIDLIKGNSKKGIEHIVKQREKDGSLSVLTKEELFLMISNAIVSGSKKIQSENERALVLELKLSSSSAIIVKEKGKNAWLLTGWTISIEELEKLKKLPPDERRSAYFNSASTHISPTTSRTNVGAGGNFLATSNDTTSNAKAQNNHSSDQRRKK